MVGPALIPYTVAVDAGFPLWRDNVWPHVIGPSQQVPDDAIDRPSSIFPFIVTTSHCRLSSR